MKNALAMLLLLSSAGFANPGTMPTGRVSKDKLIGECEVGDMKVKITYAHRIRRGARQVKVNFSAQGETSQQYWTALGWDMVENQRVFIIANKFGLSLVDGDTKDNSMFMAGVSSEKVHCKNDLTPLLRDFPIQG